MTFSIKLASLFFMLLGSLLLSGCSAPVTATARYNDAGELQVEHSSKNLLLNSRVKLTSLKAKNENGYLQAQVVIENRWHFTLDYSYKFVWFDSQGIELAPGSAAWSQIKVHGKTQQSLTKLAPSVKAASYKIILRD